MKPRKKTPVCAACGDEHARGLRVRLPCCRDCLRCSVFKFESAVDELRRINREARSA